MVFVIALDPASVSAAAAGGEMGCDHLIGVFEALLQNCLIAEFSGTWRMGEELKEAVQAIPNYDIRMRCGKFLKVMATRNRFVEAILGHEEDFETQVGLLLSRHTADPALDAILCETPTSKGTVELFSILAFNRSNFARERSRKASAIVYAPGEICAQELCSVAFGRLLSHADNVDLVDSVVGRDFGGNFHEAAGHWCRFFRSLDRDLSVTLHTEENRAAGVERHFQSLLEDSRVRFRVRGYNAKDLPHDRFLRTRMFTLDIGRGLDLFDREGRVRDVRIGLSDHGQFAKLWPRCCS